MSKQFQVGTVLRHRLSGEQRVSVYLDFGHGADSKGMHPDYVAIAYDPIGHISDAQFSRPATTWRSASEAMVASVPLDPATPRRFRWKNSDANKEGFGVDMLNGRYSLPIGFMVKADFIRRGYTITEWLDPQPEGVA